MHQHQHRDRNFKMGKGFSSRVENIDTKHAQEYYGHADELDAYSFTAAANMANDLRLGNPVDFKKTGIYNHYVDAFGPDHSIVSKLEKRSLKYYNILEEQYYGQQSR